MKRRAGEMGMWGVLWITLTSASGGAADLPYGLVAGLKPKRHHGFGPSRLVPRIGARSPDFIGIWGGRLSVLLFRRSVFGTAGLNARLEFEAVFFWCHGLAPVLPISSGLGTGDYPCSTGR